MACRTGGACASRIENSRAKSRIRQRCARGRRLTYADPQMRNLLLALLHLAVVSAKLCGAGGVRAVMAENLLLSSNSSSCAGFARVRRT